MIRLNRKDLMLIYVYESPGNVAEHLKGLNYMMLKVAHMKEISHLFIIWDFISPQIDWKT